MYEIAIARFRGLPTFFSETTYPDLETAKNAMVQEWASTAGNDRTSVRRTGDLCIIECGTFDQRAYVSSPQVRAAAIVASTTWHWPRDAVFPIVPNWVADRLHKTAI